MLYLHCIWKYGKLFCRHIIDGEGADTVYNGNYPQYDMKYTVNNHYITGTTLKYMYSRGTFTLF